MNNTWNALISALMLLSFATACGNDPVRGPMPASSDSIVGHDLALAPLHYLDAAGTLYELLLAVGIDGSVIAGAYVINGSLFASIVVRPGATGSDVQIYESDRALFRAIVTPSDAPSSGNAWPAFAVATEETRAALTVWQRSASGGALARVHVALGRLVAAASVLQTPAVR